MHLSPRTSLTIVGGAAVLALAANTVTYAATGDTFILGHSNGASRTTTLTESAPGPALALKSQGNLRPSLTVTSKAQVKNLNASLLGGSTAADLSSNAVTYSAGQAGDPIGTAYALTLKPGLYQASLLVVADASGAANPAFIQCFVSTPTASKVYVGSTAPFSGLYPLASSANVVKIPKAQAIMECASDESGIVLYQPMTFSLVNIDKQTVKHPPAAAKSGAAGLAAR
jgi:hypothetical protein